MFSWLFQRACVAIFSSKTERMENRLPSVFFLPNTFFSWDILTRKIKDLLQCFDPSKSVCINIDCHVCLILLWHYLKHKYLTCKSFLDTVFDVSCSTTSTDQETIAQILLFSASDFPSKATFVSHLCPFWLYGVSEAALYC